MRIIDWSSDVCSSDLTSLFFGAECTRLTARRFAILPRRNLSRGRRYPPQRCQRSGSIRMWRTTAFALSPRRSLTAIKPPRSEEHTSELQSLMRISYAVFCLKKKKKCTHTCTHTIIENNIRTYTNRQEISH